MNQPLRFLGTAILAALAAQPVLAAGKVKTRHFSAASARLEPLGFELSFPFTADSNSPAFWDADQLVLFNSERQPFRSVGPDIEHMSPIGFMDMLAEDGGGLWIEAVVRAGDGTLYAYYHHEPPGVCSDSELTAPEIGAARSANNGETWEELGIVLRAQPGFTHCDSANAYFAGGVGDFSVMLDQIKTTSRQYGATGHRHAGRPRSVVLPGGALRFPDRLRS